MLFTMRTAGGVGELYLRRSTFFLLSLHLRRPQLHQDLEQARTAGRRLARDEKEPEPPQLGAQQLPGERAREIAET
jgi:hypothetical protein